jgi:hypothetical protein
MSVQTLSTPALPASPVPKPDSRPREISLVPSTCLSPIYATVVTNTQLMLVQARASTCQSLAIGAASLQAVVLPRSQISDALVDMGSSLLYPGQRLETNQ